jgi:hypothetical protein
MNKLSLAVQTYPGANETLKRHWPHFLRAGGDENILVTTTCGLCWVPEGIEQALIGADLYAIGAHLPLRLLHTFQRLKETKSDWFCVAEYDTLFFKPIPRDLPNGLTTHLAGGKMPGAHCSFFVHNPWLVDRDTADIIVQTGYELLKTKAFDPSPDLFLGHVAEIAKIPVHTDILKGYSRNTIHPPPHPWCAEARAAIDAGAVAVHGVKDAATFEALTK